MYSIFLKTRAIVNFREYLFKKRIIQVDFTKKIEEETEEKVMAIELLFPEKSAKEEGI